MKQEDRIGIREIIALFLITVGFKLSDMTPNILYEWANNTAYMVPIISALIMALPIYLVYTVMKDYPDKTLIEVIYILMGKKIGFFLGILFFIIALIGTSLTARNNVDALSIMYFPKTPVAVLFGLFIFSCWFLASRGFKIIAAYAWVFVPVIKAVLLVLVLIAIKNMNVSYLFPVFGIGLDKTLKASYMAVPMYGEYILFFQFAKYVKRRDVMKKGVFWSYLLCAIELSLMFAIYVMVFDIMSVQQMFFPFQQLTKYVHIGTIFINIESFFLGFWIISGIIRYAVYIYFITYLFSNIFNIKEFEPLLILFASLVIFIGMLGRDIEDVVQFMKTIFYQYTWYIFIIFPFIFWVLHKAKGRRHLEKT